MIITLSFEEISGKLLLTVLKRERERQPGIQFSSPSCSKRFRVLAVPLWRQAPVLSPRACAEGGAGAADDTGVPARSGFGSARLGRRAQAAGTGCPAAR